MKGICRFRGGPPTMRLGGGPASPRRFEDTVEATMHTWKGPRTCPLPASEINFRTQASRNPTSHQCLWNLRPFGPPVFGLRDLAWEQVNPQNRVSL